MAAVTWERRARPLLGTLVEVGVPQGHGDVFEGVFQAVLQVESVMSKHRSDSDIGRFNAASAGSVIEVHPWTLRVLSLARELESATAGRFDIAQGSGRWDLVDGGLMKMDAFTRIDLGGIAKGEAVDRALGALLQGGASCGWINAGGDLRVKGLELPIGLRDESRGGLRPWATLRDGALATSHFPVEEPHRLSGQPIARHVTVAAPSCLAADALTKVVALTGVTVGPLFDRFEAQAWIHA